MQVIRKRKLAFQTKAFTLIEALLTLAITSFFLVSLHQSVSWAIKQVKESLFYLEFESAYTETQELAVFEQKEKEIIFGGQEIQTPYGRIDLPESIEGPTNLTLHFTGEGRETSLSTLIFRQGKQIINYQLRLGSGVLERSAYEE